jgi:hypothetical protein
MAGRSGAIVDVPVGVAEWLVSFGVIKAGASILDGRGRHIRQLRAEEWVDVQNGKVRAWMRLAECLRLCLGARARRPN